MSRNASLFNVDFVPTEIFDREYRGPCVFLCTASEDDMRDVRNILGTKRHFKIRQLNLDLKIQKENCCYHKENCSYSNSSDALKFSVQKVKRAFSLAQYPVLAECSYVKVGENEYAVCDGNDADIWQHVNGEVEIGVYVSFINGLTLKTYKSVLNVTVTKKMEEEKQSNKKVIDTLLLGSLESDRNFFRRQAYLKMWNENFPED